jgi:Asp-tRNA(Asn)/Glu-tRNA(Gln) amidotransferase C subunit
LQRVKSTLAPQDGEATSDKVIATTSNQEDDAHALWARSSGNPASILANPSWSVRSLLPRDTDVPSERITSKQLHHLLRLSALPLPESPEKEAEMIETLQAQLYFVRDVQSVDTKGVEPLRAIRDETERGLRNATIGLEDLKEVLDREVAFGHNRRPRRVKGEKVNTAGVEDWDPLKTASRTVAGKYFVVRSGKD